jgi:hypothetical protein
MARRFELACRVWFNQTVFAMPRSLQIVNPDMQPEGERIVDYLGRKYGRTPEQNKETQVIPMARTSAITTY